MESVDYENPENMIEQPRGLSKNLYPHQLASVYNMEERERLKKIRNRNTIVHSKFGINADKTGYGKTLAMVALILRDRMEWDLDHNYEDCKVVARAGGKMIKEIYTDYARVKTTLILVNPSIMGQWEREFSCTFLKVKKVITCKDVDMVKEGVDDVILTTPNRYNRLATRFKGVAWKRFIFDEPGHVRVPAMREVIAGYYWFVTATPMAILDLHCRCKTSFIHDLFCKDDVLDYYNGWYNYLVVKNDDAFTERSFKMPETIHKYYNCYQPLYKTIKSFVNKRIGKMISAGNIRGAVMALGGRGTNNITDLVRRKKENELQEIETELKIMKIRGDEKKIDFWSDKKRRVKEQVKCLEEKISEMMGGTCYICYDKIQNHVMETNCQNIFCGNCLLAWLKLKDTCPLCRSKVIQTDLIYISTDKSSEVESERKIMTKPHTVARIIKERLGKDDKIKVIVFSDWSNTFGVIRNILEDNGIYYGEIAGNVEKKESVLERFRNGDMTVLFLNSRYDSTGVDLPGTTDIILYHEMELTKMNQILGRALRIGRDKSLYVHHLT